MQIFHFRKQLPVQSSKSVLLKLDKGDWVDRDTTTCNMFLQGHVYLTQKLVEGFHHHKEGGYQTPSLLDLIHPPSHGLGSWSGFQSVNNIVLVENRRIHTTVTSEHAGTIGGLSKVFEENLVSL